MPHIDEGTLHAWLDGALGPDSGADAGDVARHLQVCPKCRARLDQARQLKEAASAALAGSDLTVPSAPPFASILTTVEGEYRGQPKAVVSGPEHGDERNEEASSRPSLRIPRLGLAWAASLAVVIGAGLIARELANQQGIDLPAVFEVDSEVSQEESGAESNRAREGFAAADASEENLQGAAPAAAESGAEARRAKQGRAMEQEAPVLRRDQAMAAPEATAQLEGLPAAVGCWRAGGESVRPGTPSWLRLYAASSPGGQVDLRMVEVEEGGGGTPAPGAGWSTLGPDSVVIVLPPLAMRLRVLSDGLRGVATGGKTWAADEVVVVSYARDPCPAP